jgi:hypothetical protein
MVRRLCRLQREAVVAMVDGHRSLEKLGRIAVVLLLVLQERILSSYRPMGSTDMIPISVHTLKIIRF